MEFPSGLLSWRPTIRLPLVCRMVGHRRSRAAARLVGYNWRSDCLFCGTRLVRVGPGVWKPFDQVRWRIPHESPREVSEGCD
ncbi:MAG: hypothetical protein ABIW16_01795 [Sphingomicrobium sp.]